MTPEEELRAKLQKEDNIRKEKIAALKYLDTRKLILMLPDLEEKLEKAFREEASYRNLNIGYQSSRDGDCAEAKRIIAELSFKSPDVWASNAPTDKVGKKLTAAERDAWLTLQRKTNKELSGAIERQGAVSFQLDNYRTDIEMAKKRLENIKVVLAVKTAQIEFLR